MFSLVDIEPELIIRSDHGSIYDIHKIASELKHRSSCSSCSASVVYLFDYSCTDIDLRLHKICLYSLWGILICDHDIVEEDALDELADEYLNFWLDEKWCGYEEGIYMCSLVQEIYTGYWVDGRDMANALKMFAEMIEDPDCLKFKPYIREVVERTIYSLRLVSEAGDPHEGTQMHYIDNKIELTDFTIEL